MFWLKTTTFAISCALAIGSAQAQQLTLSSAGERLETLIPKLAAASGANLSADKTTFNEVVVLDVKDAELEAVKQKIAEVTGFVWIENGNASLLVRTQDAIKKSTAGYSAWSAAWMREAANKTDEVKAADEKYQPYLPNNGGRGFVGREVKNAFGLMLRDFDFTQISAMNVGERKVLSTLRTLTQVPFDTMSHRWALKASADLMGSWRLIANGQNVEQRARQQATERISVGIKKTILAVRRTSPTSVDLDFQILDGSGNVVGSTSVGLRCGAAPRPDLPKGNDSGLDKLNKEMLRALSGQSMDVREEGSQPFLTTKVGSPFGERVLAEATQFGTVDPVAWAVGDYFIKVKPEGVNLVACVSDIAATAVARARDSGADVWYSLGMTGTDVSLKDGWLVAKPGSTYAAWQGRVDRGSFVRLFNSLRGTNGLISLDMMVDFVNAQPAWVNGSGSWETALVAAVWGQEPGSTLSLASGRSRDALAFYWASRDRLAREPRISDKATSFMSKSMLGSYLYNDERGPSKVFNVTIQPGQSPGGERMIRQGELITLIGGDRQSISGRLAVEQGIERTEFLPNGIEFDGQLSLNLQPQQSLLLVDGLTGGVVTMSIEDYAMMLAQANNPQNSRVVDPSRYTRMAMIERQVFNYAYRPTEDTMMMGALQGAKMSGTIGVYTALPEGVRAKIDALKIEYMKQLSRGGQPTSTDLGFRRVDGRRGGGGG